jgi:hypothetical protein
MAIFDVFKTLLGGEPASSPGIWKDLSSDELGRVWRAKDVLPAATRLGVRDEHISRLLPLPPVDVPSLFTPPAAGLTDERDAEQTLDVLSEYDPRAWADLGDIRVGRLGALVGLGTEQCVMIVFRGWRSTPATMDDFPALEEGEVLAAAIAVTPDAELEPLRELGIPCHGDADHPLTDPVTVGVVTALPHATYPKVLHVRTEDETTFLFGTAVPLAVLEEEPDYIIGGLSMPRDEATLEALAEGWDPQVAATSVEQVVILPDAAGVQGLLVGEFARGLGVGPRVLVNGQLISACAQPVVDAAERGAWDEVATLAEDPASTDLDEAFRVLVVSDRLDDARMLLESAPREGVRGDYLGGLVSQLAGDPETARTAYEATATGEEACPGAHCQFARLLGQEGDWTGALEHARAGAEARVGDPIAAANHAIAAWRTGNKAEAQEVMQETQLASRSWLGAMLDAMVEDEPGDGPTGLLSVAGTHLGPYASALEAMRAGCFEEGERLLRRCLDLAPEHPGAQGHLALHLAAEGRQDEALTLCESTLEVLPHHVYMLAIRGWLLLTASRFDEAVDAYGRAIEMSGDHGDWWINRILGQIAQGDGDGANRTITSLEGRVRDMDLIVKLRRAVRDAG